MRDLVNKGYLLIISLILFLLLYSFNTYGWGPTAQISIVNNALHLLDKELSSNLKKLENEIRNGAGVTEDTLYELIPLSKADKIQAIESEINLLTHTKTKKIDAYFAFRLGVLGKLIAQFTSPLQNADKTIQTLYNMDVETKIDKINLKINPRQIVNPATYFGILQRQILSRDIILEQEYKNNIGYSGTASTTLPECVSISVNAVADVWFTVLSPTNVVPSVPEDSLRNYVLQGCIFFAKRGKPEETKNGINKFSELVSFTDDMYVKSGDVLMSYGMEELAIEQYRNAIILNPNRRDVARKIADYYVAKSEDLLKQKKLEDALELSKTATSVDPLHPNAERLRLEIEKAIKDRNTRYEQTKEALDRAEKLQTLSEQEAISGRIAEAIVLLREALAVYNDISEEFPMESQQKIRGIRKVNAKIQELKGQLLDTAKNFSGKYPNFNINSSLGEINKELTESILNEKIDESFKAGIQSLLDDVKGEILEIK
ncbi:MAG: hypothetical protein N3G21_09940 [Candidatus Hydrogenedentes bacterium]|nr:hypothetical protein [Candidatus Hydrogenedentota bacterium]